VLQASNGTLWAAWQSNRNAPLTGRNDIIYKTFTNGAWSSDHNLTTTGQNSGPTLVQLINGTIGVFWAYRPSHSYEIYYTQYSAAGWSTPTNVTTTNFNDTQPAATVGHDGTVWLVWTRINSTSTTSPPLEQLFYKTWKNGVWSHEAQLTNDSNQNYGSSIEIAKDGLVRVTWSKGTAGNTYQLYTKTYNGTTWTSDTLLVPSTSTDEHPTMMQDRNGTLWLFWGRLVVSGSNEWYVIMGQYSYNLGSTWSSPAQLTPAVGSTIFDSYQPVAVQSSYGVKPIWVLYTSNYNVPNFDIYSIQSSGINPVHDVVPTGISVSSNQTYPGGLKSIGQSAIITVTVTVANIGDYVESVAMTLSATNTSSTTVGTLSHLIGPGSSTNFYYYWNTSGFTPARYGFTASITPLTGETIGNMPDNNVSTRDLVHILPLGDIDEDGNVNLIDVSVVFYDFGYTQATGCNGNGCFRWTPLADIQDTGTINIIDAGIVAKNFGIYT
jgi:hypothetical protein